MSQTRSFSSPRNPVNASLTSLLEDQWSRFPAMQANNSRGSLSPVELRERLHGIIDRTLEIIDDDTATEWDDDDDDDD